MVSPGLYAQGRASPPAPADVPLPSSLFSLIFQRGFTSLSTDFFGASRLICQIFVLTEATLTNFRWHLRYRKRPKNMRNISK